MGPSLRFDDRLPFTPCSCLPLSAFFPDAMFRITVPHTVPLILDSKAVVIPEN